MERSPAGCRPGRWTGAVSYLQFQVDSFEDPGQADDQEAEYQRFQQTGDAGGQGGGPVEAQQLLDSVPDVGNGVAGQRRGAGRGDQAGPTCVPLDVGDPVEQAEEGEHREGRHRGSGPDGRNIARA